MPEALLSEHPQLSEEMCCEAVKVRPPGGRESPMALRCDYESPQVGSARSSVCQRRRTAPRCGQLPPLAKAGLAATSLSMIACNLST
jgi:hypothetical protein